MRALIQGVVIISSSSSSAASSKLCTWYTYTTRRYKVLKVFLFLMLFSNFVTEFLEMCHPTAWQCRRLYLTPFSIGLLLLLPSLGFTWFNAISTIPHLHNCGKLPQLLLWDLMKSRDTNYWAHKWKLFNLKQMCWTFLPHRLWPAQSLT